MYIASAVKIIDLTKIPVRLYGLKALYRNTERKRVEIVVKSKFARRIKTG